MFDTANASSINYLEYPEIDTDISLEINKLASESSVVKIPLTINMTIFQAPPEFDWINSLITEDTISAWIANYEITLTDSDDNVQDLADVTWINLLATTDTWAISEDISLSEDVTLNSDQYI